MASNTLDAVSTAVPHVVPDSDPEGSESEWEYEYDDNATETFYLTVELTPALPAPNAKPPKPPRDPDGVDDADEHPEEVRNSVKERHEFDGGTPRRVQILDLHAPDPLISFKNRIYHCEWASSVSSSLFFAAHGPSDESIPKIRSTPQYNLIGISSIRIMSTTTHLAPITVARPTIDDVFAGESRRLQDNGASTPNVIGTLAPIQLNPSVDATRKAQASFLERLSTIKRAAGEQDEVTVIAKKVLLGSGWRYQRRNKLQLLEDRADEGDELAIRVLLDMYTPKRRPEVVGRPESGLGSRGGKVKARYARGRPGRPKTSGVNALFDHILIKDSIESGSAEEAPSRSPEPIAEQEESTTPQSEERRYPAIGIRSTIQTEDTSTPDTPSEA